jgi:hypothetical protein
MSKKAPLAARFTRILTIIDGWIENYVQQFKSPK